MGIRVFEAFSGVGAQRMALRNIGINHEVVGICEIDKFAIQSYNAIHGETVNFGDISEINPTDLPDFDLFTYSFPCQDLSLAGKQKGIIRGQTRSGLLYECEKIIEVKRPKYLLLENVKNLVGKNFKTQFEDWLAYLETLGYTNYWQVLNAKHYGIPQNRERVFVISILGEHQSYEFPKPIPLTRVIKDILEDEVEDRYYMNNPFKLVDNKTYPAEFTTSVFQQNNRISSIEQPFKTLATGDRGQNNILVKAYVEGLNEQNSRVCGIDGIVGALNTMQGGHREPKILLGESETIERLSYRVRKLTPLECWRLMGFSDNDFNKAKNAGLSNSQLYKQAGNSIVVPVLEGIFKELFK